MKVLWYQLTSPQLQRKELPRCIQEASTPALETGIKLRDTEDKTQRRFINLLDLNTRLGSLVMILTHARYILYSSSKGVMIMGRKEICPKKCSPIQLSPLSQGDQVF